MAIYILSFTFVHRLIPHRFKGDNRNLIQNNIDNMKKFISFFLLLLCLSLPAFSQQQSVERRTQDIFAFKDFQEAKVLQSFGRFTKAKANILLKNSTLCFIDGKTVKEAYVQNVLGVEFDSVKYMKLPGTNQMGRVVSQKGYNYLLCVTTINAQKLKDETEGGSNLPFFEITDAGAFFELDGQAFTFKQGYPLKDKYYFNIKGELIPANETAFKKYVRPEMKKAFKNLMGDRFWSWKDANSLTQLFTYLPD